MFLFETACVFLLFKLCTVLAISDNDYELLPQIYEMDDYNGCNRESHAYCKIKLILMPKRRNNKLWKIIEATKKETRYMEHDVVFRARCIPKEYFADSEQILSPTITNFENRKLENISFRAKVDSIKCKEDIQQLPATDYYILWLLVAYVVLIIVATIFDLWARKKNHTTTQNQKFITILSILCNWEALRRPVKSDNYNRLKSFQGFRIFVACVAIACHSILAAVTAFSTNTRLLEDYSLSNFRRSLINFGLHMIQPSFLISGWLHTIQIYNAVERSDGKKLTLKMVARALLIRYLRFTLLLMIYVVLQSSHLLTMCLSGPQTDLLDLDNQACQSYWWANLLLINNFFYLKDMCNFASWYMSCDFQAHLAAMALFYLMYKYNLGMKLFAAILVLVITVKAYILYNTYTLHGVEIGVTYLVKANDLKLEKFMANDLIYIFHTSSITNFSSYLVGILFGALYYRCRQLKVVINKDITAVWVIGHFGLQALVVTLSLYNYSPFVSAVIGALLKPLFSIGIAIGVWGMSHNIGGFVKKFFEWNVLEFGSRWIFSIYVFHLLVIFYRSSTWTYMPELSYFYFVKIVLIDIFLSFALGLMLHLIVERPLLSILQIIFTKQTTKSKTN